MYHERCAYRAKDASLEISEYIFGKWVVKIIRNDKCSRRQAERTRTTDALHRPDLCYRAIIRCHQHRLPVEDAVENAFRISLDLFYRDVHGVSLTNIPPKPPRTKCSSDQ